MIVENGGHERPLSRPVPSMFTDFGVGRADPEAP
jgi:hypothetical protein